MSGAASWTKEEIEHLRSLWFGRPDLSRRDIAGAMAAKFGRDFTKNMVIGQANRQNLPPRQGERVVIGNRVERHRRSRKAVPVLDIATARKKALQIPRDCFRVMNLIRDCALAGKPAPTNSDICRLVGALSPSTASSYRRRLAEVMLIRVEDVSTNAVVIHAGPLEIETRGVAWSTADPLAASQVIAAVAREDEVEVDALRVVVPQPEAPPPPAAQEAEPLIPERVWLTPLAALPTVKPMGVRFRTCQWPEGQPGTEGFRFCDSPRVEPGKPYCRQHCLVAYVPSRPRGAAA